MNSRCLHSPKDWGYGEIPMYKEMHKITDITVKWVVYFLSEVTHRK
jgi:hypothetical protein